jgi:hypothetical protein
MSQVDFVSVLYTLVQYVSLAFCIRIGVITLSGNGKSMTPIELSGHWFSLFIYLIPYCGFSLILFSLKHREGNLSRDDIVLPILCIILVGYLLWRLSDYEYDARRARTVQYMVVKYRFESAQILKVLDAFGLSRFPIDRFEEVVGLTKAQGRAKIIEDTDILAKAKAELDRYLNHAETLSRITSFQKSMQQLDLDNYDGGKSSDNSSGRRYS